MEYGICQNLQLDAYLQAICKNLQALSYTKQGICEN